MKTDIGLKGGSACVGIHLLSPRSDTEAAGLGCYLLAPGASTASSPEMLSTMRRAACLPRPAQWTLKEGRAGRAPATKAIKEARV